MVERTLVGLEEVLEARERRVDRQRELLSEYNMPLICFTLNIPGPEKTFDLAVRAFHEGQSRILGELKGNRVSIVACQTFEECTGYEAYYVVDAKPRLVKEWMCRLEDQDALGRLFDMDVLQLDGSKLSRGDLGIQGRSCLLCGQPAPVCARSRAHSVEELMKEVIQVMESYFTEREGES